MGGGQPFTYYNILFHLWSDSLLYNMIFFFFLPRKTNCRANLILSCAFMVSLCTFGNIGATLVRTDTQVCSWLVILEEHKYTQIQMLTVNVNMKCEEKSVSITHTGELVFFGVGTFHVQPRHTLHRLTFPVQRESKLSIINTGIDITGPLWST